MCVRGRLVVTVLRRTSNFPLQRVQSCGYATLAGRSCAHQTARRRGRADVLLPTLLSHRRRAQHRVAPVPHSAAQRHQRRRHPVSHRFRDSRCHRGRPSADDTLLGAGVAREGRLMVGGLVLSQERTVVPVRPTMQTLQVRGTGPLRAARDASYNTAKGREMLGVPKMEESRRKRAFAPAEEGALPCLVRAASMPVRV